MLYAVFSGRGRRAALKTFILSIITVLSSLSALADNLTLAWDPSTDPTVTGYNLYYGTTSQQYSVMIPVGNATTVTVSNLTPGVTYYFAATSYNAAGLESAYSPELVYTVPIAPNAAPTLNPLSNITINENAGTQTVAINGITSGATNENQTLVVTATSSNTGLIPNPTVTYTSPNTNGTLTFKPLTNANGSATITVTVNDGGASNNLVTQTFTVTVNSVNQQPTLNALSNLTMNENPGLQTVNLGGITSGAANENQTLTVTATSSNTGLIPNPTANYTSPNATGSITFTPTLNGNGSATITVTVNDGGASNNTVSRTFTVTVNSVNQQPTLNPISNVTINENAGQQTVAINGISSGAANENQTLTVTASSSNTGLIPNPTVTYTTPNTNGTLTFTPALNGTGVATITVTVNDGGASNNTVIRTFTVTVNGVNQQPTLNPISNVTISENAGQQTVAINGITSGATNENQTLLVTAVSSNTGLIPNPTVTYTSPNTNGTLTFTPVANISGQSTITVTVNDGGASNNTVTRTFTVTVNAVNQQPTLNALSGLTILENAGAQTVNLSGISAGVGDNQTLTVTATSSNTGLIPNPSVTYTSPNTTGSISFTPAANQYGSANITVTVNDGGASNNTVSRVFTVVVDAPPIISALTNVTIAVSNSTSALPFTIGDPETAASSLTLSATSDNAALLPTNNIVFSGSASNRFVTLNPIVGSVGTANVTLFVSDGFASNSATFQLAVQGQPTPPSNLRISVSGLGAVTPNLSGQSLAIGSSYTLTAVPSAGQQFSGWSVTDGNGNTSTSTAPSITFVMSSNMTVKASFVSSTFTAAQSTYTGLFYQQDTTTGADLVAQNSSGLFTVTTTKKARYSGRLQIGSTRYPFSGTFDSLGRGSITVHRRNAGDLQVGFYIVGDQAYGTVSDGTYTNDFIVADRAVFNARTNPAPFAGQYTIILPGHDNDPTVPAGDSFGAVRVSKSGLANVTGTLADGTHFSQSAPVSADGNWPMYVGLYAGGGSVLSWLSFANSSSNDLGGSLNWIKPPMSRAKYYPGGFATNCVAVGSTYNNSGLASQLDLDLANVTFTGGDSPTFTNSVTMLTTSVVNHSGNNLHMGMSLGNGLFHGTVADPETGKLHPFSGAAFQKLNVGYGLLLGTEKSSRVTISR